MFPALIAVALANDNFALILRVSGHISFNIYGVFDIHACLGTQIVAENEGEKAENDETDLTPRAGWEAAACE